MKAILARPSGGFGLCEVEPPTIGPGEILVEMRACGLCGTDLAKLARPQNSRGVSLGHELAGVVRAVGPGVTRLAPGDRVMAAHHVPCGDCWACRHGNESMCPQFKATINATREDVKEAVAEMTGGIGLDGAILTVVSEAILAEMQQVLRPAGRLNIFAGPSDGPRLPLDLDDLYHRELSVFSTYSSTPAALAQAFELLASNQVWVLPLISHRLPLTAFDEGVELQKSGKATKVIFHP